MSKHLQREIERLKEKLLHIAGLVERDLRNAIRALETRDAALARQVIVNDAEVDQAEVELEEECLKVLALHQPVATDLRFIIAVLKINNDLERIGDLAVNIAERAEYLAQQPEIWLNFDFGAMASDVIRMVRESLDALVNLDVGPARRVCEADEIVDEKNRQAFYLIIARAKEQPEQIDRLVPYMIAARHLERIADHATNIAEDVIYMIEGEIVRHRLGEEKRSSG